MSDTETRAYIAGQDTGRLATVGPNGFPYVVSLNYVWHRDSIYFHCAVTGEKLNNIRHNSKVCFEVSHTVKLYFADTPCNCGTRYVSAIATGQAVIIEDETEKREALEALVSHLAKGKLFPPIDGRQATSCMVVKIVIEKLNGKKNVDPGEV